MPDKKKWAFSLDSDDAIRITPPYKIDEALSQALFDFVIDNDALQELFEHDWLIDADPKGFDLTYVEFLHRIRDYTATKVKPNKKENIKQRLKERFTR